MLDKRNQPYDNYLTALEKRKFTGNVTLHFSEGVIAKIDKEKEPLAGVTERESVKLR